MPVIQTTPRAASPFQPIVGVVAALIFLVIVVAPLTYVLGPRLVRKLLERREHVVHDEESVLSSNVVVARPRMSGDHKKVARTVLDLAKVKLCFVELVQEQAKESKAAAVPNNVARNEHLRTADVLPGKIYKSKRPAFIAAPSPLRNVLCLEPEHDIMPVVDATTALQEFLSSLDSDSAIAFTPSPSAASVISPSSSLVIDFPAGLFSASISYESDLGSDCDTSMSFLDATHVDDIPLKDLNSLKSPIVCAVPVPELVIHQCADLPLSSSTQVPIPEIVIHPAPVLALDSILPVPAVVSPIDVTSTPETAPIAPALSRRIRTRSTSFRGFKHHDLNVKERSQPKISSRSDKENSPSVPRMEKKDRRYLRVPMRAAPSQNEKSRSV
ncbi:hypothetical protein C8F01DRAFT_1226804 [Mycena amicta]|nr:hypothetical protein C8F01DRAFT_1226804 [Mycena amicta]